MTNLGEKNIDAIYYRDGLTNRTARNAFIAARLAMFKLFMREMTPTGETSILDIGVADEETEGANFLEKLYPWQHNIVCAGIGNGEVIRRTYPKVAFQPLVPAAPLPISDGPFDIAYSL